MFPLRGLQDDPEHEELQRLRQETLLQRVSTLLMLLLLLFTPLWEQAPPSGCSVLLSESDGSCGSACCYPSDTIRTLRRRSLELLVFEGRDSVVLTTRCWLIIKWAVADLWHLFVVSKFVEASSCFSCFNPQFSAVCCRKVKWRSYKRKTNSDFLRFHLWNHIVSSDVRNRLNLSSLIRWIYFSFYLVCLLFFWESVLNNSMW